MDFEAFDAEAFSGAARRPSQGPVASAAACEKQWIIASLDNMVFPEGTVRSGTLRCRLDQRRRFDPSEGSIAAMSRSALLTAPQA
eukprot:7503328-Pyramimonas_sp.AAC.1